MFVQMLENYGSLVKDQVVRVAGDNSDWLRSAKKGIYIPKILTKPFVNEPDFSNQEEEYEW